MSGISGALSGSASTVAAVSAVAAATVAAGYVVYQQRETLFGNRGYDAFEKKYAEQLKASRQHVTHALGGGAITGSATAADEGNAALTDPELSSFARVKVIYGSDSGNAEAFAKGLVMTLVDRGVSAALIDPGRWPYLDHYVRQDPKSHGLFVFPTRTAGKQDNESAAAPLGQKGSEEHRGASTQTVAKPATQPSRSAGTPQEESVQEGAEGLDGAAAVDEEILLFVVATAGEGEPTANFQTLFQEMQLAVQQSPAVAAVAPHQGKRNVGSSRGTPARDRSARATSGTPSPGCSPGRTTASSAVALSAEDGSEHHDGGPRPVFSHIRYAVFALGDSSYKYYCRAAMSVDTLLKKGGGRELHRIGFGDAHGGFARQEESFDEWQDGVLHALVEDVGLTLTPGSMKPPQPQMRFVTYPPSQGALPDGTATRQSPDVVSPSQDCVEGDGNSEQRDAVERPGGKTSVVGTTSTRGTRKGCSHPLAMRSGPAPFPPPPPLFEPSQHRPSLLQMTGRQRLTAVREDDGSAVYRLSFSLEGTNVTYQAGDHLGIYPPNPPAAVNRCAALLGLTEEDLSQEVELQEARTRTVLCNTLPARVTLRTALTYYTDLCGKPKKSALRLLAKYCTNDGEKKEFLRTIDLQRVASVVASVEAAVAESRSSSAVSGTVSPARTPATAAMALHSETTSPPPSFIKPHSSQRVSPRPLEQMVSAETSAATTARRSTVAHANGDSLQSVSTAPLRTVLDFMERFPSCCGHVVPVGHFLEVMPRIQPRYYSIATDRTTHPTQIDIFVRAVPGGLASEYLIHHMALADKEASSVSAVSDNDDDTRAAPQATEESSAREQRKRMGTLRQLRHDELWHEPSFVFAYVRFSTFHLPASLTPTAPLLMIGPGTGAAAMIGLLYRREALMRKQPEMPFGECLFFFGARHAVTEFFVQKEVTRWCLEPADMEERDATATGEEARVAAARRQCKDPRPLSLPVISLLECAFSRDGEEKVYVTDLIAKHGDYIYDMMMNSKESMIFLSGDATKMAKDVDRALVSLLQQKGKKGRLSALGVLQNMEAEHRYLKDVY